MLSHTAGLGSASPQSSRDAAKISAQTPFSGWCFDWTRTVNLPLHALVAGCPTSVAARRARCCSARG